MRRCSGFSLVMVALSCLALAGTPALGGCADKMGSSATSTTDGLTSVDPSMTHSSHVLGEHKTLVTGPMGSETSALKQTGMEETNSGSALKQRAGFTIGDNVKAMLSAASDFDMAGIKLTFKDGKLETAVIDKLATSNSEVQRAVNEGLAVVVTQWINASKEERAVLEKQLDVQARMGDAVAKIAQAYIETLKKASIPVLP